MLNDPAVQPTLEASQVHGEQARSSVPLTNAVMVVVNQPLGQLTAPSYKAQGDWS
jgi:hypothetical protein